MSNPMDKFTYMTIYKQDFCIRPLKPRAVGRVAEVDDCRARFVPGIALGIEADYRIPSENCICHAGGLMPQRGAVASGLPTNLDFKCTCFDCGKCQKQPRKTTGKEIFQRKVAYAARPGPCAPIFRRSPVCVRRRDRKRVAQTHSIDPDFEGLRPMARGKYGGQFEGPLNLPRRRRCWTPSGNVPPARPNIIPWARERRDERREPDILRLRRVNPRGEVRDVVHGEEGRSGRPCPGPRRRNTLSGTEVRIPGPFWTRPRPDERREVDIARKRKFERRLSDVSDVIHGGGGYAVDERLSFGRYRKRPGPPRTQAQGQFWLHKRPDERRELDVTRKRKFERYSEVKGIIHGDAAGSDGRQVLHRRHSLDLPRLCRPKSSSRIPGPFWMHERTDARREPDIDRRKKVGTRPSEVRDVIHGEEDRAWAWLNAREGAPNLPQQAEAPPINLYDLPPGPSHADPFWFKERPDERRDPDIDRKRKFGRERIEAAEIIHGEDFRENWYPSFGPVAEDLRSEAEIGMSERRDDDFDEDDEDSDFPYERVCKYGPDPIGRGWDDWTPVENPQIPYDLESVIRETPVARLSCAPASEAHKFDQPNTFMRKLYEKYPYLYKVLRETPPDELVSRVFKDRFLSTYQVDYLHMGIGREQYPRAGAEREERYTGPDGEPEPQMIPGCSYRYGQKVGKFGRKNTELPKKDKEEETVVQEIKEEPRISEYMATISKLGGEIISDQLYKVSQITKNMKNQYNSM